MNNKITSCITKSPLGLRIYTYTLLALTLLLLIILVQGRYGKQEIVNGVIRIPSHYRISATKAGNVNHVYVKEGQRVKKGDELFQVSLLWQDAEEVPDISVQQQTLNRLMQLKAKYEKEKSFHDNKLAGVDEQRANYIVQITTSLNEAANILQEYKKKQSIYKAQLTDYQKLLKDKAINKSDVETLRQMNIDNDIAIKKLKIERSKLVQEKVDKELFFSRTELEEIQSRNLLDKRLSDLHNEINSIRLQQDYTVRSPVDAIVNDVAVMRGDFVDGKFPAVILKQNNDQPAEAVLYLSGKQIGLLNEEQKLFLRIDTLPYQDYGTLSAHIVNIASTPTKLSFDQKESWFRVRLKLEENDRYSRIPLNILKDGMTVTTSLRQPKQSLIEWLFLPVTNSFKRNPDFFDEKNI